MTCKKWECWVLWSQCRSEENGSAAWFTIAMPVKGVQNPKPAGIILPEGGWGNLAQRQTSERGLVSQCFLCLLYCRGTSVHQVRSSSWSRNMSNPFYCTGRGPWRELVRVCRTPTSMFTSIGSCAAHCSMTCLIRGAYAPRRVGILAHRQTRHQGVTQVSKGLVLLIRCIG